MLGLLATKFSSSRVTCGARTGSSTSSINPVSARICRRLISCLLRFDSKSRTSSASERVSSVCWTRSVSASFSWLSFSTWRWYSPIGTRLTSSRAPSTIQRMRGRSRKRGLNRSSRTAGITFSFYGNPKGRDRPESAAVGRLATGGPRPARRAAPHTGGEEPFARQVRVRCTPKFPATTEQSKSAGPPQPPPPRQGAVPEEEMAALFVFEPPLHQLADSLARRAALIKHGVHLLGDGHLDPRFARQLHRSGSSAHTFGHHAHRADNLIEPAALAQLHAHGAVAAERAGARQHQIAHAGQPRESFAQPAQRAGQTRHLRKAASDQRGGGVVAEAQSLADSCSDGDDVFHRAAQLDAGDIVIRIQPECRPGEVFLQAGCQFAVGGGNHDSGGVAAGDLASKARARKRGHARSKLH